MNPELFRRDIRTLGSRAAFAIPFGAPEGRPQTFVSAGCPQTLEAAAPHLTGMAPYARAIALMFRLKSYRAGWNGPRSEPADKKSFDLAIQFVELLADRLHVNFAIEPAIFADGTAILEVEHGDLKMFLEFTNAGGIAANVDKGANSQDFDLEGFDGTEFPIQLDRFFKS